MTEAKQNKRTPIKSSLYYYNERFPKGFLQNFLKERENALQEFKSYFQEVFREKRYQQVHQRLLEILAISIKIYGMPRCDKEFYLTLLLKLYLQDNRIFYLSSQSFGHLIKHFLKGAVRSAKNLKLNWKVFYNVLEKNFLRNDLTSLSALTGSRKNLFDLIQTMVVSLRRFFDDESDQQVFQIFRQNISPIDQHFSVFVLFTFLQISSQMDSSYFQEVLEEIMEFSSWKMYTSYESFFFALLQRISRRFLELKWEEYYDQIFVRFQKYFMTIIPNEGREYSIRSNPVNPSWLNLPPNTTLIASIMVHLLVPSNHKSYNLIWEHEEKLIRLLKNFLHPSNSGRWTETLLNFISRYVFKFVQRNSREIQNRKKMEKNQKPLEDEGKVNLEETQKEGAQANMKTSTPMQEHPLELLRLMSTPSYNPYFEQQEDDDEEDEEDEDDADQPENEAGEKDEEILGESLKDIQPKDFQNADQNDEDGQLEDIKKNQVKIGVVPVQFDFHIDDECQNRFVSLILEFYDSILLLKDTKHYPIYLITQYTTLIDPARVMPIFLKKVLQNFQRNDINLLTTINLLNGNVAPLLTRTAYKQGLYEIPNILQTLLNYLSAADYDLSYNIWKFVFNVTSNLPVNDPEDMEEEYLQRNPGKEKKDFISEINSGEEIDMVKFYSEYSDIVIDLYKQYVTISDFIDMKKAQNDKQYRTLHINIANKFWSVIFNSSKRVFNEIFSFSLEQIQNKISANAQRIYSHILQAIGLKSPDLLLKKMVPFIISNLIRKRTSQELEEAEKQPMFFLVANNPQKEEILKYIIEDVNEKTLLWYLNLLEDAISYGRIFIKPYIFELEKVILLAILHKENQNVWAKGIQILHRMFMSIVSIFPLNLQSFNPNEKENDLNFDIFYHRYLGMQSKQKFQVLWQEPGTEQRGLLVELLKIFWNPVFDYFQAIVFKREIRKGFSHQEILGNFDFISKHVLSGSQNANKQLRTEMQRSIMIVRSIFGAVQTRAESLQRKANRNYFDHFGPIYFFSELKPVIPQLLAFLKKLTSYLLQENLLNNVSIAEELIRIISYLLGCDEMNSYLQSIDKWIANEKSIGQNPYLIYPRHSRFLQIVMCMQELQRRIFGYTYINNLGPEYLDLIVPIMLLIFHSYDHVSAAAWNMLEKTCNNNIDQEAQKLTVHAPLQVMVEFIKQRLLPEGELFVPQVLAQAESQEKAFFAQADSEALKVFRILKYTLKFLMNNASKMLHLDFFDILFQIVRNMDMFKDSRHKKQIIDVFPYFTIFISYESRKQRALNLKFPEEQQLTLIVNSCEEYRKYLASEEFEKIYRNNPQNYFGTEEIIKKSKNALFSYCQLALKVLNNEATHWRDKSLFGMIALYSTLHQDFKSNPAQMQQLYEAFTNLLASNDMVSRNLGRSALFVLLRKKKRSLKEETEINLQQNDFTERAWTMEELTQKHFLRSEDLEKNLIKTPMLGYFDYYSKLYESRVKIEDLYTSNDYLRKQLIENEFALQFIEGLLHDLHQKEMMGTAQSGTNQNALNGGGNTIQNQLLDPTLWVNFNFNIDVKKDNLFRRLVYYNEFYLRLFKQLFQWGGYEFFQHTKERIREINSQYEKKDHQSLSFNYTIGMLRAVYGDNHLKPEQAEEMENFAFEIIFDCLNSLSRDFFNMWMNGIISILFTSGYKNLTKLKSRFETCQIAENQDDPKYIRILILIRRILKFSCYRYPEWADQYLKDFMQIQQIDLKQSIEYAQLLSEIIRFTYIAPLNLKLIKKFKSMENFEQFVADPQNNLVYDSQFTVISKQPIVRETIDFIASQSKNGNEEERQSFSQVAWRMIEVVKTEKLSETLFYYLENLIVFYIEFQEEEIDNQALVNQLNNNVVSLATLNFDIKVIDLMIEIILRNLKNQNWRIRLRALKFYHHFVFGNSFHLKNRDLVSPILDLLVDDQTQVSNKALSALSDIYRITAAQQVQGIIEGILKQEQQSEKEETQTLIVFSLMAAILSQPFQIQSWTDRVLGIILKNKKFTKKNSHAFKDFTSKYLKFLTTSSSNEAGEYQISDETLNKLKEIANPYNYFA